MTSEVPISARARVVMQGYRTKNAAEPRRREHVVWVLMHGGVAKYTTADVATRDSWVKQEDLWLSDRFQLVEVTFLA